MRWSNDGSRLAVEREREREGGGGGHPRWWVGVIIFLSFIYLMCSFVGDTTHCAMLKASLKQCDFPTQQNPLPTNRQCFLQPLVHVVELNSFDNKANVKCCSVCLFRTLSWKMFCSLWNRKTATKNGIAIDLERRTVSLIGFSGAGKPSKALTRVVPFPHISDGKPTTTTTAEAHFWKLKC